MRVAVHGAGGVGGYFGGRPAESGVDVHLLARGAHLAALRELGLRLRSVAGDATVDVAPPATPRRSARVTSYAHQRHGRRAGRPGQRTG